MTLLQKFLFPVLFIFLYGCAAKNNTLDISPAIVTPQSDPTLMGIAITISSADRRGDTTLARLNRDGHLVSLTPSRDLRFLLQEALEKQMAARGYMIGGSNNVQLQVIINHLSAEVQEGNFRHNIDAKADISIQAETRNGKTHLKNYRAHYNIQGAFAATNQKVADAMTNVLDEVIADMSRDTSISQFIKQNSR